MERIYGFIVTSDRGRSLIEEWGIARTGLDILADYKQVVGRLASASATLVEPESPGAAAVARRDIIDCVNKLQSIRTDL